MVRFDIPQIFRPHHLVRGGHAQTLAGYFLPAPKAIYCAMPHRVALSDGDQIVLHDDGPDGWQPGGPVALLLHGLGGGHCSGYMQRVAHKLNARGVRTFRMDLRGCSAGLGLARLTLHAGRSDDARAALEYLAQLCPASPTSLVGFSLSGNLALKMLAEAGSSQVGNLCSTIAVCPPVDLAHCSRALRQGSRRVYDRWFVRLLMQQLTARQRIQPDAPTVQLARMPRSLWDFDDCVTAPLGGFAGAADYYARSSAAPRLAEIKQRTLVVISKDDPLVPAEPMIAARRSAAVELLVAPGGGHMGFIGARGPDPDCRWLDWRIVDWITGA